MYEKPSWLREQKEDQRERIASFLRSPEGSSWSARTEQLTGGRRALILEKEGGALSHKALETLAAYQSEYILRPPGGNINRSDCNAVAIGFETAFERAAVLAPLRREGFLASRISIGTTQGRPLRFFRGRGFGFHVANLLERYDADGVLVSCAAVDLTTHYTMDLEEGHADILVIVGPAEKDVLDAMDIITDGERRWSRVHSS